MHAISTRTTVFAALTDNSDNITCNAHSSHNDTASHVVPLRGRQAASCLTMDR